MDPSYYKGIKTSRGINYSYIALKPKDDKPVLVLLHGFPSTSYDWRYQVAFFKERGFGLIVPDMLGYGGTDKPTDPEYYKRSLLCKDVIDILDAENVQQAIAIGHDWGSTVTSRLANSHHDRFIAFGFLAVAYTLPRPIFDIEALLNQTKKAIGYELFGYWKFFSDPDAASLIEKNWDSFFSALFPDDSKLWISLMGPSGALRAWVESGKTTDVASWMSVEDRKIQSDNLLTKGGIAGPLCWYKVMLSGINAADDKSIPPESYVLEKPVFFGGALKDPICLSIMGKASTSQTCKNATIREFDAGHWLIMEKKDEVNQALLDWIEVVLGKSKV